MNKEIIRRKVLKLNKNLTHLHPVLQRIYLARNISSPEELSRELRSLLSFSLLSGITQATKRLMLALKKQQNTVVIGDFDTDGATSTALMIRALREFGMKNISYLIPNRFTCGYGLTTKIVEIASAKRPNLIVTVDNGISSYPGVVKANQLGIDVLITDHHLPNDPLPPACAIVNPNCKEDAFPSKCLSGVGVSFYLMLALRAELKKNNWFDRCGLHYPNMAKFLDFVALGTIADVVPLDKNNRILVYQGLQRIRAGKAHEGVLALLEVSGRKRERLRTSDLGFSIGPRLNAAGRLEDMSLGVDCLLADNKKTALYIAHRLDNLNQKRRVIASRMQKEAFSFIDRFDTNQPPPPGVCLYREEWHQGIIGLIASQVRERIHRPTIAFSKIHDNMLQGSARSVSGLHICNILETISIRNPELIKKFGGHAMAAGLSISLDRYTEFQQAFSEEVNRCFGEKNLRPKLITDGTLTSKELTLEFAELIEQAEPWGQGFPEPTFDGYFKLINQKIIRQQHLKLILQISKMEHYLEGFVFHINAKERPDLRCRYVRLVYRLNVNEFRGRKKLQLLVDYIQPIIHK
ncbi:single-stranded-DNA-specific exonuclease RecJ [Coxiella endosymbiont of Amblyomma sculptum]|uniref:single-stranded-DNA-specific exonuclease RecJ n=1 Tax=Coxiella endosymbiont of Amblyomma sculptum TaxID=2487929 RepID=UPI00132E8D06|nr:single-stranded-DNA-specific exonuclease RecJ [Coxiella endosymbiont of Amblyomma sculptum]QHG92637.1 single-stranded-DNA-specific exonuclease RecJ [Coxiella endosymbiont of Amblyomma sculptum]